MNILLVVLRCRHWCAVDDIVILFFHLLCVQMRRRKTADGNERPSAEVTNGKNNNVRRMISDLDCVHLFVQSFGELCVDLLDLILILCFNTAMR